RPRRERIGDEGVVLPEIVLGLGQGRGDGAVEVEMDAAFLLVEPAPAAGARILALAHRRGARRAADRLEALRVERVLGQMVRLAISDNLSVRPVGERVDLDAVVAGQLEMRQHATLGGLVALAAGDPAAELL